MVEFWAHSLTLFSLWYVLTECYRTSVGLNFDETFSHLQSTQHSQNPLHNILNSKQFHENAAYTASSFVVATILPSV